MKYYTTNFSIYADQDNGEFFDSVIYTVVFPRIFSRGGQNFALAASPLAMLFLLASLAKHFKK